MCVVFTDKDGQLLTGTALLDAVRQQHPEWVMPAEKLGICRIPVEASESDVVFTSEQIDEMFRANLARRLGFSVEELEQAGYFD